MEKPKIKVNARQFVNDLRSGMSVDELMSSHGLNPKSLEKLFTKLVANKLIDESEIPRSSEPKPIAARPLSPSPGAKGPRLDEPLLPERLSGYEGPSADQCPQCGATVTSRALTCPECGHVLPGQQRWEEVEPKRPLTDRIPPLLLGTIIALPIAVVLFFFFSHVLLPMTEKRIEKKTKQLQAQIPKGKSAMGFAKEIAKFGSAQALRKEIQRLISENILAEVDKDYSLLVTGTGWNGLSKSQKTATLREIQRLMSEAGMQVDFEVKDLWGKMVGTVVDVNIMLEDELALEEGAEAGRPEEPLPEEEPKQERIRRGPIDNILPDLKLPGHRPPVRP